jgi:rhamnulokinase
MSFSHYLAFDLGAESGRSVLGSLQDGRVSIREIHRFPNIPAPIAGGLRWNVAALFEEIKKGLALAARSVSKIESVAVDTWGVDFGLFGADGGLLGSPFCYRDARHLPAMKAFLKIISPGRLYRRTGLQLLPFNSLFQLYAHVLANSSELPSAARLLFMPGLFTYLLSGVQANDTTIASTSQLADPTGAGWCEDLLATLGVPVGIMGHSVPPGTTIGRLSPAVRGETGCPEISVTATAGHDTASAVAAVPAEGEDWAYLSSGTWSLLGIETESPIITAASRRFNFTNERGLAGRTRFLKNISGLWLLQQCRRRWSEAHPLTYERMWAEASAAPPFRSFIDPDSPEFLNPPDMPSAIQEFCRRTGQPVPESPSEISRCALESLALKYRAVLDELRAATTRPIRRIFVIGGGSQNGLLNAFTAAATGLPVIAGPVEATAIGNILVQASARGRVRSPEEIRAIVARSFALQRFNPEHRTAWDIAYDIFRKIPKQGDHS